MGASRNNFAINANDVFFFYFSLCSPRLASSDVFKGNRAGGRAARGGGSEKNKNASEFMPTLYISFIFNLF